MAIINALTNTLLSINLPTPVSFAARTIFYPSPAAGTTPRSRTVTGTIPGSLSGAGPVFGTGAFAFSLPGAAAVALPGTLALSSASSLTTAPAAAGQKDIHTVIVEISGHPVCGLGSG